MTWDSFIWFAATAALFWLAGAAVSVRSSKTGPATILSAIGSAVFLAFIIGFWITLQRPPMRTMGETRLWFSLFLSVIGIAIYSRWKYKWILPFSAVMSIIYVCVNIFKPEIHSRALMPALQSAWFIPHVIVYMFAYAIMGAATLFAIYLLVRSSKKDILPSDMKVCDTLVRIGWGFLTLGIVMGALWAKQAWGDFWTWDPKETWAAITWLGYLMYLHIRKFGSLPGAKTENGRYRIALGYLLFCFILLQMCWWGVNYLQSIREVSMHTY